MRPNQAESINGTAKSIYYFIIAALANHLATAQIAQSPRWLEKCQAYTAENLAQTFHRLRAQGSETLWD